MISALQGNKTNTHQQTLMRLYAKLFRATRHCWCWTATAAGVQDNQATKDAVATTVGVLIFWPTLFLIGGDKLNAAQLAQLSS
jgi:hypothetical protein